jgi:hypothetical protein
VPSFGCGILGHPPKDVGAVDISGGSARPTLWVFREKLAKAGLIEKLFGRFDQHLGTKGYMARGGQMVDARERTKR